MDGQWALDAYADAGMWVLQGLGGLALFLIGSRVGEWISKRRRLRSPPPE